MYIQNMSLDLGIFVILYYTPSPFFNISLFSDFLDFFQYGFMVQLYGYLPIQHITTISNTYISKKSIVYICIKNKLFLILEKK